MTIETEDDVAALKRIGKIVSQVLQKMLDAAEPGMTTRELDPLGAQLPDRSSSHTERSSNIEPRRTMTGADAPGDARFAACPEQN
jgi:methionine aminopeptidase